MISNRSLHLSQSILVNTTKDNEKNYRTAFVFVKQKQKQTQPQVENNGTIYQYLLWRLLYSRFFKSQNPILSENKHVLINQKNRPAACSRRPQADIHKKEEDLLFAPFYFKTFLSDLNKTKKEPTIEILASHANRFITEGLQQEVRKKNLLFTSANQNFVLANRFILNEKNQPAVASQKQNAEYFFPYQKSFLCYWLLPFVGFVFTLNQQINLNILNSQPKIDIDIFTIIYKNKSFLDKVSTHIITEKGNHSGFFNFKTYSHKNMTAYLVKNLNKNFVGLQPFINAYGHRLQENLDSGSYFCEAKITSQSHINNFAILYLKSLENFIEFSSYLPNFFLYKSSEAHKVCEANLVNEVNKSNKVRFANFLFLQSKNRSFGSIFGNNSVTNSYFEIQNNIQDKIRNGLQPAAAGRRLNNFLNNQDYDDNFVLVFAKQKQGKARKKIFKSFWLNLDLIPIYYNKTPFFLINQLNFIKNNHPILLMEKPLIKPEGYLTLKKKKSVHTDKEKNYPILDLNYLIIETNKNQNKPPIVFASTSKTPIFASATPAKVKTKDLSFNFIGDLSEKQKDMENQNKKNRYLQALFFEKNQAKFMNSEHLFTKAAFMQNAYLPFSEVNKKRSPILLNSLAKRASLASLNLKNKKIRFGTPIKQVSNNTKLPLSSYFKLEFLFDNFIKKELLEYKPYLFDTENKQIQYINKYNPISFLYLENKINQPQADKNLFSKDKKENLQDYILVSKDKKTPAKVKTKGFNFSGGLSKFIPLENNVNNFMEKNINLLKEWPKFFDLSNTFVNEVSEARDANFFFLRSKNRSFDKKSLHIDKKFFKLEKSTFINKVDNPSFPHQVFYIYPSGRTPNGQNNKTKLTTRKVNFVSKANFNNFNSKYKKLSKEQLYKLLFNSFEFDSTCLQSKQSKDKYLVEKMDWPAEKSINFDPVIFSSAIMQKQNYMKDHEIILPKQILMSSIPSILLTDPLFLKQNINSFLSIKLDLNVNNRNQVEVNKQSLTKIKIVKKEPLDFINGFDISKQKTGGFAKKNIMGLQPAAAGRRLIGIINKNLQINPINLSKKNQPSENLYKTYILKKKKDKPVAYGRRLEAEIKNQQNINNEYINYSLFIQKINLKLKNLFFKNQLKNDLLDQADSVFTSKDQDKRLRTLVANEKRAEVYFPNKIKKDPLQKMEKLLRTYFSIKNKGNLSILKNPSTLLPGKAISEYSLKEKKSIKLTKLASRWPAKGVALNKDYGEAKLFEFAWLKNNNFYNLEKHKRKKTFYYKVKQEILKKNICLKTPFYFDTFEIQKPPLKLKPLVLTLAGVYQIKEPSLIDFSVNKKTFPVIKWEKSLPLKGVLLKNIIYSNNNNNENLVNKKQNQKTQIKNSLDVDLYTDKRENFKNLWNWWQINGKFNTLKNEMYSPRFLIKNRSFILTAKNDSIYNNNDSFISKQTQQEQAYIQNNKDKISLNYLNLSMPISKKEAQENAWYYWEKEKFNNSTILIESDITKTQNEINLEKQRKYIQKKRRRKKLKKETRRRKKRKRFYPRPTWLRYRSFLKLLNKRKKETIKNKILYDEKPSHFYFANNNNQVGDLVDFSDTVVFTKQKQQQDEQNKREKLLRKYYSFCYNFYPIKNKNSFKNINPPVGTFFVQNKDRPAACGRRPQAESIFLNYYNLYEKNEKYYKEIQQKSENIFSMHITNKENFIVSRSILVDFKKLLWKSYWLRSNLNPYLKKVRNFLTKVKKSKQKWEFFQNLNIFLNYMAGFNIKTGFNVEMKNAPSIVKKNEFGIGIQDPRSPGPAIEDLGQLNQWENTLYFAEYNRITYYRIQEFISQIRENFATLLTNKMDSTNLQTKNPVKANTFGLNFNGDSTLLKNDESLISIQNGQKLTNKVREANLVSFASPKKSLKVRSSHLSHSKMQDNKRYNIISRRKTTDFWVKLGKAVMADNQSSSISGGAASQAQINEQTYFKKQRNWGLLPFYLFNEASFANNSKIEPTNPQIRIIWALSKIIPSLNSHLSVSDGLINRDPNNKSKINLNSFLYKRRKTWSASTESSKFREQTKYNKTKKMYRDLSIKLQTLLNEQNEFLLKFYLPYFEIINKVRDANLASFSSYFFAKEGSLKTESISFTNEPPDFFLMNSFASNNNVGGFFKFNNKLLNKMFKKIRQKEDKSDFLNKNRPAACGRRPQAERSSFMMTKKGIRLYKKMIQIKEPSLIKLSNNNNEVNNNLQLYQKNIIGPQPAATGYRLTTPETHYSFFKAGHQGPIVELNETSQFFTKEQSWFNNLTNKTSFVFWWTIYTNKIKNIFNFLSQKEEIYYPIPVSYRSKNILSKINQANEVQTSYYQNITNPSIFANIKNSGSLTLEINEGFLIKEKQKSFPLFNIQKETNDYILKISWICSLLFHFCSILSLISFSQIRDLLKFYLLGISKIYKISLGILEYIYYSYNRFKFVQPVAHKNTQVYKNHQQQLKDYKSLYNEKKAYLILNKIIISGAREARSASFANFLNKPASINLVKNYTLSYSFSKQGQNVFLKNYERKNKSFLAIKILTNFIDIIHDQKFEKTDNYSFLANETSEAREASLASFANEVYKANGSKFSFYLEKTPFLFFSLRNLSKILKREPSNLYKIWNFIFAEQKQKPRWPELAIETQDSLFLNLKMKEGLFASAISDKVKATKVNFNVSFLQKDEAKITFLFFIKKILTKMVTFAWHINNKGEVKNKESLLIGKTINKVRFANNNKNGEFYDLSDINNKPYQKIVKSLNYKKLSFYFKNYTILYSLVFLNILIKNLHGFTVGTNIFIKQSFDLIGRFGPKSIFNLLEKPGELIIDWIAYMFLVEWSSDMTNTIPENVDIYLGTSYYKFIRTFHSLNFLNVLQSLHFYRKLMINNVIPLTVLNFKEPYDIIKETFYWQNFGTEKYDIPILNLSILNLASTFIQNRIYHLFEILLFQFYQPDSDLIVRQKKGIIFWDIWGDFLMQVAEDSNINISELTSLKEEQIKLLEKSLVASAHGFDVVAGRGLSKIKQPISIENHNINKEPSHNSIKKAINKVHFANLVNFANKNKVGGFYDLSDMQHFIFTKQKQQFVNKVSEARDASFASFANKNLETEIFNLFKLQNLKKDGPSIKMFASHSKRFIKTNLVKSKVSIANPGQQGVDPQMLNQREKNNFVAQQFLSYQGKDTELFIDLHPPKSFTMISILKKNESVQTSIGSLVCQIFSGIMSKQISKNILVVGNEPLFNTNQKLSDLTEKNESFNEVREANFVSFASQQNQKDKKSIKKDKNIMGQSANNYDFSDTFVFAKQKQQQAYKNSYFSRENQQEKTLLIQAIAGETELKIITDNAYRYAMVYRGVAVGIKLLRDVFDSLSLHTPCLFLIEDIHAIGERRPLLISDDEKGSSPNGKPVFGSQREEIHEKNQVLYQLSKHVISHYRKPYKGDFSLLIPTNHFCFDLFKPNIDSFNKINPSSLSFPSPKIFVQSKSSNDSNQILNDFLSSNLNSSKSNGPAQEKNYYKSRLLIKSSQLFAPPATSPFSVLNLKEQKKFQPYKIVSEMPWGTGLRQSSEQIAQLSKTSYSIRVKVAVLADMAISTLSVKLDMITDLLVIIDSVKGNRGFVVFATTHIPYILDPALRRPGRLDETITLGLFPNLLSRWNILKSSFGLFIAGKQQTGFRNGLSVDLTYSIQNYSLPYLLSTVSYQPKSSVQLFLNRPAVVFTKQKQESLKDQIFKNKNLSKFFFTFNPYFEHQVNKNEINNLYLLASENTIQTGRKNEVLASRNTNILSLTNKVREANFVSFAAQIKVNETKYNKSVHTNQSVAPSFVFTKQKQQQSQAYTHINFWSKPLFLLSKNKQMIAFDLSNQEKHDQSLNNYHILENNGPAAFYKCRRPQAEKIYKNNKKRIKILSQIYYIASNLLYETNFNTNEVREANLVTKNSNKKTPAKVKTKGFNFSGGLSNNALFLLRKNKSVAKKENFLDFLQPLHVETSLLFISLYASPQLFQNYIIKLMSGKLAEFFLFSNIKNNTNNNASNNQIIKQNSLYFCQLFLQSKNKAKAINNITDFTSLGLSNSWKILSSLILSFIQKRYLYNNNLIIPKFLDFNNKNSPCPKAEVPSPPSSNIFLPARRYENYRRSFAFFTGRTTSIGIIEKIQTHQQQRLIKRLYGFSVKETFKSEVLENRFTSFTNANLMIGSFSSLLQKPSNSNWFFKNRILIRHKNYLINQWWNAQLPEHNAETTFLSDIDWRYTFVELIGDLLLDFPDADQHYNPKNRRWLLTKGDYHNWFNFEKNFYNEIYTHFIFNSFIKAYNLFENNREVLDFYAFYILQKGFYNNHTLNELEIIKLYKRFLS